MGFRAVGDFPAVEQPFDHRFGDFPAALPVLGEKAFGRRLDVHDADARSEFVKQAQAFAARPSESADSSAKIDPRCAR